MKTTIQQLLGQLNHGLVEREDVLKLALLSVLAGENLLLIGPPGTGKSMIARRIAESMASDGAGEHAYFEYLLTKFSTPEEIFGPLSITELKADRFKRNTHGYLPTVRMAFLDEIFKASSSILNALLTILNERIFHNGSEAQHVPMQALIAASNELPADQDELGALYDRFLIRRFVDYVSEANLGRLFDKPGPMPQGAKLSVDHLHTIRTAAEAVRVPEEIADAVQRIWIAHKQTFKEDARERLSDRRLKKVIKLLCVSAATNGRDNVDLSDVFLLKDCLWNHPDNAIKVRDLIFHTLRTFSRDVPPLATGMGVDEAQSVPPSSANQKRGSVLGGFIGSGTLADPFLVESYHHFMDLTRSEVGAAGYYFKQIADIDCTALDSWMYIVFKGHYDGGGHTVTHQKSNGNWHPLFEEVRPQSSIRNVQLQGMYLVGHVWESELNSCSSSISLVRNKASASTILYCKSNVSIVRGTAVGCTIAYCLSNDSLIRYSAEKCNISDCLVDLDVRWTSNSSANLGGIAATLSEGSIVDRCFVAGRIETIGSGSIDLHGIAHEAAGSVIQNCAVGNIEVRCTVNSGHVRFKQPAAVC